MCLEKKIILAIIVILALLIIFMGAKGESLQNTTTIDLNGVKVNVARSDMGWLTSGADLRDQVLFSSTNQ